MTLILKLAWMQTSSSLKYVFNFVWLYKYTTEFSGSTRLFQCHMESAIYKGGKKSGSFFELVFKVKTTSLTMAKQVCVNYTGDKTSISLPTH